MIVLEALAFAPIHNEVVRVGVPARVSPELTATVQRLAPAIPRIAALFGITVDPKAQMPRPLRNEWRDKKAKGAGAKSKTAAKPVEGAAKPASPAAPAAAPAPAATPDASVSAADVVVSADN